MTDTGWVLSKEKQPQINQTVMVWPSRDYYGVPRVAIIRWEHHGFADRFTHWRMVPEPPVM